MRSQTRPQAYTRTDAHNHTHACPLKHAHTHVRVRAHARCRLTARMMKRNDLNIIRTHMDNVDDGANGFVTIVRMLVQARS